MFEEIVYRGYGPHHRKGGGFSTLGVKSEKEFKDALAAGWYESLTDAIAAYDNKAAENEPVVFQEPPVILNPENVVEMIVDMPSRAELERRCAELGIDVHHRNSDATLQAKIDDALKK